MQVDLATEEGLLDSPLPPTNRSSRSTLIYPLVIALGLSFPLYPLARAILQRLSVPLEALGANFWRVILGFVALSEASTLGLGVNEFFHYYTVKREINSLVLHRYSENTEIVTGFQHNENRSKDWLWLSGNWDGGNIDVQSWGFSLPG